MFQNFFADIDQILHIFSLQCRDMHVFIPFHQTTKNFHQVIHHFRYRFFCLHKNQIFVKSFPFPNHVLTDFRILIIWKNNKQTDIFI